MEALLPVCSLCEIKTIHTKSEPYCEFNKKKYCMQCISKLTTSIMPTSSKPVNVNPDLKENASISIGSWDKCLTHGHKERLLCVTCNSPVCVLCVPNHDMHKFQSIEDLLVEHVPHFYEIDFLIKYAQNDLKNDIEGLKILENKNIKAFSKLQNQTSGIILKKCRDKIEKYSKRLQDKVPFYAGKLLSSLVYQLKNPYNIEERLGPSMHWIQWNSKTFFTYHIETNSTIEHTLPEESKFPHFCRSIQISSSRILACGGRDQPNGNGLTRAFIIDFKPFSVKNIPDMHSGRANHLLIYLSNFVYVIGGCDHENKYSNRVERLCIKNLAWELQANCNEIRDSSAGVGLESENALYVFGGRYSQKTILTTIEKFLVASNMWISLDIKLKYSGMVLGSVMVSEKDVLIFAGQDENAIPLTKVNLVDLNNNEVREIEDFSQGGCVVNEPVFYKGKVYTYIFVSGASRKIYSWDPQTRIWNLINSQ